MNSDLEPMGSPGATVFQTQRRLYLGQPTCLYTQQESKNMDRFRFLGVKKKPGCPEKAYGGGCGICKSNARKLASCMCSSTEPARLVIGVVRHPDTGENSLEAYKIAQNLLTTCAV